MSKYFEEKDYKTKQTYDGISFELHTTDSYSENKVEEAIFKTDHVELLQVSALQMAIVGTGQGNLGTVTYKGESFDLKNTLKNIGVKVDLGQNEKLEPEDLTPRRLQRYYRFAIRDFLAKNLDCESYLFRKYSDHDQKYRSICFPGGEHLVKTIDEAAFILQTYINVDRQLGTKIAQRIERVLLARNIMSLRKIRDIIEKINKELPEQQHN